MIPHSGATPPDLASQTLTQVDQEASVVEASKQMRKSGAAEVLVTSQSNGMALPLGIVTAMDIITRVIAAELDPAVLTMGDIAWRGSTGLDRTYIDKRQPHTPLGKNPVNMPDTTDQVHSIGRPDV